MGVLGSIAASVIRGDDEGIPRLIGQALGQGIPAREVLVEGLQLGMAEVGRRFRECEFFVPEVLIAAEAMKAGMEELRPHLAQQGVQPAATAVVGTVKGDLHDIGKNLVAMMLEGAGFEVVDLGVDVSAEKFAAACRQRPVQLVAMSALLTTTIVQLDSVIRYLKNEVDPVPVIIVGGAAVTQEFADQIGADGYGRDAATGAIVARRLCFGQRSASSSD
ncbi:MAG TPA: corrinoid protein [Phycisphaerae bacterium]|nr:corrinoid protein [Phycisphaerae bacterium]HRY70514.1 corrinoid protein [Phycisphaerae bacterium]HSA28243.1 corrinoid protein [Phycisphaerae bacterium]